MRTAQWTTGTVASGGEEIYYESAGDGDAVVLCHGLGGNHAVWYQQVPVLAQTHRVVTWDQRGFGMSTNRANDAGPAAAVQDLTALLDHLSIDRAHVIGQSMGGWAVMGFATTSPGRVTSLVVCDSTAGVWTDAIGAIFAGRERPAAPQPLIGEHSAIGDSLRERDLVQAFLYQQVGGFRTGIDDAEMVSRLFATRYASDDVAALSMRVLLVVGGDDQLIPPAVMREVANVVPNEGLVEIDDAGHSPYFEQPAAWNDAVASFIGR
jgi:3-oxoadipate enol-lactonase